MSTLQQMPGWISVNERVPTERDGTVAVLCDDGAILTAWATYWHGARHEFAQWTFPHPDDGDSAVTHWHPLAAVPLAVVRHAGPLGDSDFAALDGCPP